MCALHIFSTLNIVLILYKMQTEVFYQLLYYVFFNSNNPKHRTKRQDHIQQSLEILRGLVSGAYHEDMINSTRRIARRFCEHGGGV